MAFHTTGKPARAWSSWGPYLRQRRRDQFAGEGDSSARRQRDRCDGACLAVDRQPDQTAVIADDGRPAATISAGASTDTSVASIAALMPAHSARVPPSIPS